MSSIMNPITKKAYKAEFETSNITLEELYKKYDITKEELGSTENWEKRASVTISAADTFKQIIKPEVISDQPAHSNITPEVTLVDDKEDFLTIIQDTKELALTSTKQFFEDYDTDEVTTKEFKDMVGVLKDLESGELIRQGKDTGPTVNILIQNLTEKFQDDC